MQGTSLLPREGLEGSSRLQKSTRGTFSKGALGAYGHTPASANGPPPQKCRGPGAPGSRRPAYMTEWFQNTQTGLVRSSVSSRVYSTSTGLSRGLGSRAPSLYTTALTTGVLMTGRLGNLQSGSQTQGQTHLRNTRRKPVCSHGAHTGRAAFLERPIIARAGGCGLCSREHPVLPQGQARCRLCCRWGTQGACQLGAEADSVHLKMKRRVCRRCCSPVIHNGGSAGSNWGVPGGIMAGHRGTPHHHRGGWL